MNEQLFMLLSNVRLLTKGEVLNLGDDDTLDIINVTPFKKCDKDEQESRLALLKLFDEEKFPTRITSSVLMEGGLYVTQSVDGVS